MKKCLIFCICLIIGMSFLLSACGKAETIMLDEETTQLAEVVTETPENSQTSEEIEVTETTETDTETETQEAEKEPVPPQPSPPQPETTTNGYVVSDPDNTRGLSDKRTAHGFGTASNGQRPSVAINSQRKYDASGYGIKALSIDLKSSEKVLYLTFSCGYEYNNNTLKILDVLKEKDVKAAFFCELGFYRKNPQVTKRFIDEGHILGNHTATHPDFPTLSRTEMASQVYQVDKFLKDQYGYDCKYFRFPGGYWSHNSMELVASVGHRMVFWSLTYRDWETANQKGADHSFDSVTKLLHPGAVISLHTVSDDNVAALGRIIDYARQNGYVFKSLDEYSWE